MTITKAGIYDLSEEAYHDDPCPAPSLSRSVAQILIDQSPMHARVAHPRLNPKYKPSESAKESDIGTIAHDIVLAGADKMIGLDFPDWRTKAAKEAREEVRAKGKIPVLLPRVAQIKDMMDALHEQLAEHEHAKDAFKTANKEKTVIWQEEDIWCRAKLDHFDDEFIDDYKTTGISAEPESWIRKNLFEQGGHLQSVFYPRGLMAIDGKKRTFRFIVQENYEPYAISVITVDPVIVSRSGEMIEYAINTWSDCLREGRFPGYTKRMAWATMPQYIEKRWLDKMDQAGIVSDIEKKEQQQAAPSVRMAG